MAATWELLGGDFPATSTPVVVAQAAGRLDVFMRSWDNGLWHKSWDGRAWQPAGGEWAQLYGDFPETAQPTALRWGPDQLAVVALGWENGLWHKGRVGASWQPAGDRWERLGGDNQRMGYYDFDPLGVPAACSWGTGRLDLFMRSRNNTVRHKWSEAGVWEPTQEGEWARLGGTVSHSPIAVAPRAGRVELFARSWEGVLWRRWWADAAWGPPSTAATSLANAWDGWLSYPTRYFAGQPLALVADTSPGQRHTHVFGRDWDNRLVHLWFDDGWEALGAESAGGHIFSDPAVAVAWPGRYEVVVRGGDNSLWHTWGALAGEGAGWGEWTVLGGQPDATARPVLCVPTPGRLDVFVRVADGTVAHCWLDGTGWQH